MKFTEMHKVEYIQFNADNKMYMFSINRLSTLTQFIKGAFANVKREGQSSMLLNQTKYNNYHYSKGRFGLETQRSFTQNLGFF